MSAFFTLLRKQLVESRWLLGLSALALFAFGWLGVFQVAMAQREMRRQGGEMGRRAMMFARAIAGEDAEITTGTLEMLFWVHPFVWLPVVSWVIARGSLSVAGEIERGTMDMTLSRPVRRSTYLLSQAVTASLGVVLLVGALMAGNLVGTRYNAIEDPPEALALLRPAATFVVLGFCVFGFTLMISSADLVRWRSTLIGASVTIASYAAWMISNARGLRGTAWETWLKRLSIFTAFNPIEAIGPARDFGRDLAILGGIGALGIAIGFLLFCRRDLPTSA